MQALRGKYASRAVKDLNRVRIRCVGILAHGVNARVALRIVGTILVVRVRSRVGNCRPFDSPSVVVSERLHDAVRLIVGRRTFYACLCAKVIVVLRERLVTVSVSQRRGIGKSVTRVVAVRKRIAVTDMYSMAAAILAPN